MNRKRNDLEIICNENHHVEPILKRIKSPIESNDSPIESQKMMNEQQKDNSNGILTSAQPSLLSFPNRKRRSRNVQEIVSGINTSTTTSLNGQIRKKSELSCVVCSDLAHGYNFDAISCESCKAFFRRNALYNMDRLKCRRDGNCDITPETRRRCKSCRLKKCFTVGMRKEWILTEEEKINKKLRIEENRRLRISTIDESTHGSEKTSPGQSSLDLQCVLLKKNDQSSGQLSTKVIDHDIISNIAIAYREGFQLDPISYGWSYPLARKITALCQILNTKNTTALRLISFYKRLPEFDALNDMDKVNLVKSNLRYMFLFQAALGYDPETDVYYEENSTNDKPVYGSDILEAYGFDIHVRCTLIIRQLHSIAQVDKRIIQLALVIFLFSKGLSNLINPNEKSLLNHRQVLDFQNLYVEQLWFLLEKLYGSARTICMFSKIVHQCLLVQNLLRDIQQDVHEKLDLEEVSPIMRSVIHLT